MANLFAELPEDVGRLTFELVVESSPRDGAACSLVSKKVKSWYEIYGPRV
jgi:hypothetical protein